MNEVVLVDETVKVPKEAKEVKDLLVAVVKDLHEGKSAAEIGAGNLLKLQIAIEGFNKIPLEAKTPQIAVLAGLLGGQVGEVFLTPKV